MSLKNTECRKAEMQLLVFIMEQTLLVRIENLVPASLSIVLIFQILTNATKHIVNLYGNSQLYLLAGDGFLCKV